MSYVSAIVLAAGRGLRLGSDISKPLIPVNSKPVVIYCLNTLSRHPGIKEIVLVANSGNLAQLNSLIKKYRVKKVKRIVLGGLLRQDSARRGLEAVDARADLVLIHDAVRPFIGKEVISSAIEEAAGSGAAIVGVPVKATIKSVRVSEYQSIRVSETLDRSRLWEIQTPQVFKKKLIQEAYKRFGNTPVTDDAMLVEKLGRQVRVVMGAYSNIKITTPDDLVLAEAILKTQNVKRKM